MTVKKRILKLFLMLLIIAAVSGVCRQSVYASGIMDAVTMEEPTGEDNDGGDEDSRNLISIGIAAGDGSDLASVLQMLLVLTIISLAPSILVMLTSFTRIIIVLHFIRTAMGTQTVPPNQIMTGLALFLTIFIMSPTFKEINEVALQPLSNSEISAQEAFDRGVVPIRSFMLNQTPDRDLRTFVGLAGIENEIESYDDIPLTVIIPSFIISELRIAFTIGFLIYLPFIVIDMVVASTLMSMGMMMLAPTIISLPFKVLLFVMVDGWNLVIENLVRTFY